MRGWSQHVRGATKLVVLRGMEQLNSSIGLELFRLVRLQNVSFTSTKVFAQPLTLIRQLVAFLGDPKGTTHQR